MKICFILHQVGPYHHARFQHLAGLVQLSVLEIKPESKEYDWITDFHDPKYKKVFLKKSGNRMKSLFRSLGILSPELIIVAGWSDMEYFGAVLWGKLNKVPVASISDSTSIDAPRKALQERMKGVLIKSFSAFLVAGKRSKAYLAELGFKEEKIFQPWDVVDNDYFKHKCEVFRESSVLEEKYKLPARFILCVARYIPKKNHLGLIKAFKLIKNDGFGDIKLVLLGSGPEKRNIEAEIKEQELEKEVLLYDFIQYDELPFFYAKAKAMVLPSFVDQWGLVVNEAMASGLLAICSENCGCVDDLIPDRAYGFRFKPTIDELYLSLKGFLNAEEEELESIRGRAAQNIENFSLQSFASAVIEIYKKLNC